MRCDIKYKYEFDYKYKDKFEFKYKYEHVFFSNDKIECKHMKLSFSEVKDLILIYYLYNMVIKMVIDVGQKLILSNS